MNAYFTFVSIVIIVFAILETILFFKMWSMTNNVRKIKDLLLEEQAQRTPPRPKMKKQHTTVSGWNTDITDEEFDKAQSLLEILNPNEVIIKMMSTGEIIIYNKFSLFQLKENEYKIIYQE